MKYSTVIFERKENYALVTLNRPDKLNALNKQMFDELDDILKTIELDKDIYGLILTGSGDKAFAAGADIVQLHECGEREGKLFSEYGSYVMRRLELLKIPTIAAVNGFALGGGCELTLACTMRYSSENAKFGQPEVNLGIIPGYGGTQRLTAVIGKGKSAELILTGNMIKADEALRLGLVNAVFPAQELLGKVEDMMKLILSKGKLAVSAAVECINANASLAPADGLSFESVKFGQVCGTDDFKEGTGAFIEKRKAEFKNK
ncbi:MAG: enoyl-CoA hydratase/isomerase family protein [Chlorobi bacterium]|nr:enoyl-CoA hydratase/isomerase family protein [Chlorobiota bacterium]